MIHPSLILTLVVPVVHAQAPSACDSLPNSGVNCGQFGQVTAESCASSRCCWRGDAPFGSPQCFLVSPPPPPAALSVAVCDGLPNSGVNCGQFGQVTAESCAGLGCCWRGDAPFGSPQCFRLPSPQPPSPPTPSSPLPTPPHPPPTLPPFALEACPLDLTQPRDECGWLGITSEQCFGIGCCFRRDAPFGTPQCFELPLAPPPAPILPPNACNFDDPDLVYGDVLQGAASFAPLVGVACSGACFREGARWSGVALSHGDADVVDGKACRELCLRYASMGCQVFSWVHRECRLMRSLDPSASPLPFSSGVVVAANYAEQTDAATLLTGAATCGAPIGLRFPDGLAGSTRSAGTGSPSTSTSTGNRRCMAADAVYGAGRGVCDRARLIQVYAPPHDLELGVIEGWWNDTLTVEVEPPLTAEQCQARCAATNRAIERGADGARCGGFTLSTGICQLRASIECQPSFGAFDPAAPEATASDLVSGSTLAGPPEGCVNSSHLAAFERPLDPYFVDNCTLPRCTTPVVSGAFIGDTFAPHAPCRYEVYGTPEVGHLLAGSWTTFVGGSNLLLLASAFTNLMHPELVGPYSDRDALEALGVPPSLLSHWDYAARVGEVSAFDLVWEIDDSVRPPAHKLAFLQAFTFDDIGGRANLAATLARAPGFLPQNSVRVTYVNSLFCPESAEVIRAVEADPGWQESRLTLPVQNGRAKPGLELFSLQVLPCLSLTQSH